MKAPGARRFQIVPQVSEAHIFLSSLGCHKTQGHKSCLLLCNQELAALVTSGCAVTVPALACWGLEHNDITRLCYVLWWL